MGTKYLKKPTQKQLEAYETYKKLRSLEKTAIALNKNYSTVRKAVKRCEELGMPVLSDRSDRHLRIGYLAGKTTQHIDYRKDPDGQVIEEWLRSTPEEDNIEAIIEYLKTRVPASLIDLSPVTNYDPKLMLQIDLADIHFGMHAWGKETLGGDYDIKITQSLVSESMAAVYSRSGRVSETLIVLYGDNFHADFFNAMTENSKNFLDMDGRYPKVLYTGLEAFISAIDIAAMNSDRVRVIVLRGNHDQQTSVGLQLLLHVHYRSVSPERVTIDMDPSKTRYHVWGCTAQNFHHGDDIKPQDLCGDLMQYCAIRDIVGIREWRANQAHKHKEECRDISGVLWECKPSPVAKDAYAARKGYWSRRAVISRVFHKDFGELSKYTVTPRQVEMMREAIVAEV